MSNFVTPDRNLNGDSRIWANWMSELSPTSCVFCIKQHGKILEISIVYYSPWVNAHPNCNCAYVPMRTKLYGTATDLGEYGADAYLVTHNCLPEYYVKKLDASLAGWIASQGNLATVLPGKMIGGDIYENRNGKLPTENGRIWYEADINYSSGFRNTERILYSNDGLIFVTYDHYKTFYEITR